MRLREIPKIKWFDLTDRTDLAPVLRVFKNDKFLVQVRQNGNTVRLTVNRMDYELVNGERIWRDGISWDELQEIKNQCGYRDKWLCEYYPPHDEMVNVANMRHLWVIDRPENKLNKG